VEHVNPPERYKVSPWHGEYNSVFYILDTKLDQHVAATSTKVNGPAARELADIRCRELNEAWGARG
jgi:hypothetical protein